MRGRRITKNRWTIQESAIVELSFKTCFFCRLHRVRSIAENSYRVEIRADLWLLAVWNSGHTARWRRLGDGVFHEEWWRRANWEVGFGSIISLQQNEDNPVRSTMAIQSKKLPSGLLEKYTWLDHDWKNTQIRWRHRMGIQFLRLKVEFWNLWGSSLIYAGSTCFRVWNLRWSKSKTQDCSCSYLSWPIWCRSEISNRNLDLLPDYSMCRYCWVRWAWFVGSDL